jgi:hypothetical protein
MEHRHDAQQFTRPLTLPSGRRVEVVYFESTPPGDDDQDLHRCGTCDSDLVQPIDWSPLGRTYWQVTLRCPNCGWAGTGVFAQDVLDRFDRELDRGTRCLSDQADSLSLENMTAEITRFVAALAGDHILPSDF